MVLYLIFKFQWAVKWMVLFVLFMRVQRVQIVLLYFFFIIDQRGNKERRERAVLNIILTVSMVVFGFFASVIFGVLGRVCVGDYERVDGYAFLENIYAMYDSIMFGLKQAGGGRGYWWMGVAPWCAASILKMIYEGYYAIAQTFSILFFSSSPCVTY